MIGCWSWSVWYHWDAGDYGGQWMPGKVRRLHRSCHSILQANQAVALSGGSALVRWRVDELERLYRDSPVAGQIQTCGIVIIRSSASYVHIFVLQVPNLYQLCSPRINGLWQTCSQLQIMVVSVKWWRKWKRPSPRQMSQQDCLRLFKIGARTLKNNLEGMLNAKGTTSHYKVIFGIFFGVV